MSGISREFLLLTTHPAESKPSKQGQEALAILLNEPIGKGHYMSSLRRHGVYGARVHFCQLHYMLNLNSHKTYCFLYLKTQITDLMSSKKINDYYINLLKAAFPLFHEDSLYTSFIKV